MQFRDTPENAMKNARDQAPEYCPEVLAYPKALPDFFSYQWSFQTSQLI